MKKALIAMSGGVDSSVAACLMQDRGCDCIGVTMRLHGDDGGEKSCCTLSDVEDARSVCARLGIPFYVFNFKADFEHQVIDRFVEAYECGATPNPCVDCNRYLKFGSLFERAKTLSCDFVVTGHYARIEEENGRYLLKKALDDTKDQSYMLYCLTQEQLAHAQFPLGTLRKSEARALAEERGLLNARKRDSQDICFVPDGDYAKVIEERTGKIYPEGSFVDREGRVLGVHKGLIRYTIGQRKGLGLALKEPMYVLEKRIADNTVVLAPDRELYSSTLSAKDCNFIAWDTLPETLRCSAKIRYRHSEQPCTVTRTEDGFSLTFDTPQRAIAKGQSVVLYDGDTVLGGGVIA